MVRLTPDRMALLQALLAEKGIASKPGGIPKRSVPTGEDGQPITDAALSSAQNRLWFLEQFEPGTSLYNDSLTLRIRTEKLDVTLLRRAFEEVVRRHDVLRTSFHLDGTRPVQRVRDKLKIPFRLEDVRHYPDPQGTMERVIIDDVREPFLLDEAPLFNAILFRVDDDDWTFALATHHIVSDAVSYGIIYREIGALYEAYVRKERSPLKPLTLQFADYAEWERQRIEEADHGPGLEFWKSYLGTDHEPLAWPAKKAQPQNRGACYRFELSQSLTDELNRLCKKEQLTSNWVLLAAYFTLLHTLGGQEDLRIGVPSSARTRSELQDLVGFFIQTLVLRLDLSGNPTFLELVGRLKQSSLEASKHEDVPFEQIVQALRADQTGQEAPLIQAWFAHMRDLIHPPRIAGTETSYEIVDGGNARFELSLIIDEKGATRDRSARITGFFEYDVDLFDAALVAELCTRFKKVVMLIVEHPTTTLELVREALGPLETLMPEPEVVEAGRSERKRLNLTKRRAVVSSSGGGTGSGSTQEDWVDVQPLFPNKSIPFVVRPKLAGLDLVEWTRNNADYVERLLWEYRALLFRGFQSGGIEDFGSFVEAASRGERLEYKDRSTPRGTHGDRIYDATVYPADQEIRLHNEGTYWQAWAKKIFFASIVPAVSGGETPIADVHRVHKWLDPKIRREFEERGVLYVRNFNNGLGLTWQEVFQTQDRAEVEAYCRDNDIEFEWKDGERLRTRQRRPAIRRHHLTGEPLWFNHAAFFHVSALDPTLRRTFLSELGEDELPYNTYYGDGGEIFPEVISHILQCYHREKVMFTWEEGDVALYDNMRIAHGRQPYQGNRKTLVAMSEVYRGTEDLRQTG